LWWADLTDEPAEQIDVKRVSSNIIQVNGEYLFVNPITAQRGALSPSRADATAAADEMPPLPKELLSLPSWEEQEGALTLSEGSDAEDDELTLLRRYDERIRSKRAGSHTDRQARVAAMMRSLSAAQHLFGAQAHEHTPAHLHTERMEKAEEEEEDPFRKRLRSQLTKEKLDERQRRLEEQRKAIAHKYATSDS
jgi:hypothetical protein